jgi:hypothetical protein
MGRRPRSAASAASADQSGVVETGPPAQGCDDVVVDAAGADGGVGNVDQVVAGGFGAVDGRPCRHGFARADLTGDHGDAAGGDAIADTSDRLVVISAAKQHARGQAAPQGPGVVD